MNSQPITPLDTFELALLAELKSSVRQGAIPVPGDPSTSPRRRLGRRGRRRTLLAVADVVVLGLVLLVPVLRPTPAYAVTGRNTGEIHVRVNRLEGAAGLEQALRERGISADVTYLAAGTKCASGRYEEVSVSGLALSISKDRFDVTIPPNSVGADDAFVLSASVVPIPTGVWVAVDFGVARGAVAPCRVVDAP